MKKPFQHGEKLFTIEFSSSYDYDNDYDDPLPQKKTPKLSPKKPIIIPKNTTRIKKEAPNLGGLIELSDSYYESNDSGEDIKSKIKKINIKAEHSDSENNDEGKDVFILDDAEQNDNYTTDNVSTKTTVTQIKNNTLLDNNQNDYSQINNDQDDHVQTIQINQTNIDNKDSVDDLQNQHHQDDPSSKPSEILEPQEQESSQTPLYLITRERKTHLNGRRIFFNLYIGNEHIYTAKCKTKSAHHVYIMKGNDVHLNSDADAIILIGNDSADFSLRKKKDLGSEILTVRIIPPKTTADTSRKMTISFFTPFNGTPKKIFTKSPGLNPDGKIEHDFEGRFAIESIKNAVLVAKPEGPKMMFIRKTGEDSIEIEAKFEHEDLWIFAIGIASFLSKVKGAK